MKNLFDSATKEQFVDRISLLNSDSQPGWGKMSVGQMCAHCALVIDTYNGTVPLEKPSFMLKLMSGMIKKIVVGPKPYKKNNPTAPQFKIKTDKNFDSERTHLLESMKTFSDPENREKIVALGHPLFGQLSEAEKGWAMYKHLDHHLTQFGV